MDCGAEVSRNIFFIIIYQELVSFFNHILNFSNMTYEINELLMIKNFFINLIFFKLVLITRKNFY